MMLGDTDEIVQVWVKKRLTYAIQNKDLQGGKSWYQGIEGLLCHVFFEDGIFACVFKAHGALQVAPGRCLHNELCGVRLQGRR